VALTRRLVGWSGAHLRALGLSFLLVISATAVFWFYAFFVPGQRQAAIDSWRRDLDVRAEIRKVALERYFVDGLADAQTLAAFPTVLEVLATNSAGAGRTVADTGVPTAHLERLFGDFVRIHGALGVILWDAEGKPRVKSSDLVLDAACTVPAREVLASGAPAVGFHLHAGLGAVLTFSAPVRGANGKVHGAVVVAADPRAWLYPLFAQPLAGTSTGEALLVGRDGADALFLSPLRHNPAAPMRLRRPLRDSGFAARSALEGEVVNAGPYVDYRGVRVLTGARRVSFSPWAVIVKIDVEEALAAFRKDVRQRAVAWGALLVALLAAAVGLWRWLEVTNEVELARSEARFEAFLEEADDAIFLLSPRGGVLDANRRAEHMYGVDRGTLLRWSVADLRAPGERKGAAAAMEALNREGRSVATTVHRRADGSTFPAEVRSRRIQLGTADFLFAIVRDITARKASEDRIHSLNRLLRTLFDANQVLVRATDEKTLMKEVCRILVSGGYALAWIGRPDRETMRVVPVASAGDEAGYLDRIEVRWDDTPEGRGPMGIAIREGRLAIISDARIDPMVTPWRDLHPSPGFGSIAALPIRRGGAVAAGLIVYALEEAFVDDEEVRLLEELAGNLSFALDALDAREALRENEAKLRALTEELESRVETRTGELKAANKELEAFSYSVSHDLRAPLRAMDGFSRILLSDHAEQLDAEGRRLLDVVRASTRQMGQLIDDLLAFSRVGRQAMARTAVDMKALADEAFRSLVAVDERVSFTVGELPRADVDPSLMRQVWVNLISNSLKFTRPEAGRVIAVAGRTEPGRVVYSVTDNGVGFDMAYSDKLFGVFQRLHSSAEFEGTGVGLALVQRIVHRHGGEVWAEGKVGEGATFSFSLPRPGGSS
jgi:PAS domain S-box-containing protein